MRAGGPRTQGRPDLRSFEIRRRGEIDVRAELCVTAEEWLYRSTPWTDRSSKTDSIYLGISPIGPIGLIYHPLLVRRVYNAIALDFASLTITGTRHGMDIFRDRA